MLRPEALIPDGGPIKTHLAVEQRLMLGSRMQLHLSAPSGAMLIAEVAGTAEAFQPGMTAPLGFAPEDIACVQE